MRAAVVPWHRESLPAGSGMGAGDQLNIIDKSMAFMSFVKLPVDM